MAALSLPAGPLGGCRAATRTHERRGISASACAPARALPFCASFTPRLAVSAMSSRRGCAISSARHHAFYVAAAESCTDTGALDAPALLRYAAATALQLGLMVLTMLALDRLLLPLVPARFATACVGTWFLTNSFKSSFFSPLDNSRPTLQSERDAISSRKRPSWMPPPLAFPIVWTTMGVLRTAASVLVWQNTGALCSPPLIVFMLHLCVGDTWNTINNAEQRLGVAAAGVLLVLGSAVAATLGYAQTVPLAGAVLAPLPMWLLVASALVIDIWRLNGGAKAYPLYPTVGSAANARAQ